MRKKRYWACRSCGKIYRRKRKEFAPSCCGSEMHRCTTWPEWAWNKQAIIKNRKQRQKAIKEKKISVIFNSHGKRIKISTQAKRIWKKIERKTSRHGFLDQANHLVKRLFDCVHEGKINGWTRGPTVSFARLSSLHGHYQRSMFKGIHIIEIHIDDDIECQKETLLHEILHWLDSMSKHNFEKDLNESGHYHDNNWNSRLDYLKKKLNVKPPMQRLEV